MRKLDDVNTFSIMTRFCQVT